MLQYSKICVAQPLSKSPKIGRQNQLSLNAGQKSCRMLQGGHSAMISTFIQLYLSFRISFYLFMSGRSTHVSLYALKVTCASSHIAWFQAMKLGLLHKRPIHVTATE